MLSENNLDLIKKDLSDLGVSFNNYVSEKKSMMNGLMENIHKILKKMISLLWIFRKTKR